jgi:glutamyl-tRNA reductase
VRGLLGDIEDIEAQLSDESKRNQTAWRAGARRVLRLKNEEARYLRAWVKRKRAERKIRDVVGGVEMNGTALLQAARNKLERVLTHEEDRELLHAIDLYLQHIA